MPAYFNEGFFVREPAWHGMGVVLDDYPGREKAMELAGHNFRIIEVPSYYAIPAEVAVKHGMTPGPNGVLRKDSQVKKLLRDDNLQEIAAPNQGYEIIQNDEAYDVAEILFDTGFRYETGITLKEGAVCALTLRLDEPIMLPGDDSITLPFGCLSWTHDGTGALRVRSGAIRQVCANTVSASEAEGRRLGTDFTFRHTKNVADRISDAKLAIKGVRDNFAIYQEAMEDLIATPVTKDQRELFVHTLIPLEISAAGKLVSDRVIANVDEARNKVFRLFDGPTIPEAHKLTAYGLHLAGIEYLDHLRGWRNQDTYVGRQLLKDEPAKAKLRSLIREVVKA